MRVITCINTHVSIRAHMPSRPNEQNETRTNPKAHAPLEVRDGLRGGALVGHGAVVEEEEAVEAPEDLELGLSGIEMVWLVWLVD